MIDEEAFEERTFLFAHHFHALTLFMEMSSLVEKVRLERRSAEEY